MLKVQVTPAYESTTGILTLSWSVEDGRDLRLTRNVMTVRYSPALPAIEPEEVAELFCGCLLPHLALQDSHVAVTGFSLVRGGAEKFWTDYLGKLGLRSTVQLLANVSGSATCSASIASGPRPALYFGGGVESLSLLSLIRHLNPYLLTIGGPSWMNSDDDASPVKKHLQEQLSARYGLEFLRVWTDARTLFAMEDTYVNRYISGTLMYYLTAPMLRIWRIGVCYMAAELEYIQYELPFDQSLHARFLHNVTRPPLPPLLSPLNAVPKIELLETLHARDPELCSHLYSCYRNTAKRWCGNCGKCRRISAFCDAIGISKNLIGMEEGIDATPETGEPARYWKQLEIYRQQRATHSRTHPPERFKGRGLGRFIRRLLGNPVARER